MTIALVLFLGALALAWTAAPLLAATEEPVPTPEGEGRLHHLVSRKDALYESIRDLDFEFQTGKLTEADYKTARAEISQDAAVVLRALDADSTDEAMERWIEGQIAARTAASVASLVCPACKRGNPEGARFCDACGQNLAGKSCPGCHATLREDAHFCNNCGKRL